MKEEEVVRITGKRPTIEKAETLNLFVQTFFKHIIGVCVKHG